MPSSKTGGEGVILYLDTSALVKLFLNEEGRDLTISAVAAASESCTSAVACVEARSAFARKLRDRSLDTITHRRIVEALNLRWPAMLRREVTLALASEAGELAQRHLLRGYDAVHLASALDFGRRLGIVTFLAFGDRLNTAAADAGLMLYRDSPASRN